jgi:hypothetical protein
MNGLKINQQEQDPKVAQFPSNDGVASGVDYQLVPDGKYQVAFDRHEISSLYGGKLYLWFKILPFYGPEINDIKLFRGYNVNLNQKGKGFSVRPRGDYAMQWRELFGRAYKNRYPVCEFKNMVFLAQTRTVVKDLEQKKLHANNQYSVIDHLIEVLVG